MDETGTRSFRLKVTGMVRGNVIATIKGIGDRNAAEALAGTVLYADRGALPVLAADEFYQSDLIGLAVERRDGRALGTVVAIQNFGAGDLLEVAPPGGRTLLLPFTREVVPEVDVASGRIVVDPPAGLLDDGEAGDDG